MKHGLCTLCLLTVGSAAHARVLPVDNAEEASWIAWVSPLPKQIAISRKAVVHPDEVAVVLRDGAGDVERSAAQELLALFGDRSAARPVRAGFEILLGVCDANGRLGDPVVAEAPTLARLRNADQAYLIRPAGESRLIITGLTERAVFHGAITLKWLFKARMTEYEVAIPLARVTDWPDLSERGEWGGSANSSIQRFADEKMNLIESHCRLEVTPEGRGVGSIDADLVEDARLHAVKVVPIITHLDQLQGTGIYDVYPDLRGTGPNAVALNGELVAPCAGKPKLTEILGDWLTSLAAIRGVDTVCCWLSEEHVRCDCEDCREVGQFVLETRALVSGWERAKGGHPDLKLRILLTQGSYSANDQVIATAPADVQISYYDGGRTYDSSRDEMIYPLLEDYAASGRWLGCYPQLTASWRIVCPWSGPQFIRYRMREFVRDGLQCLCGYATPSNDLYGYNVAAAAEWSWNSEGRDERQFGHSWATRRGLPSPDAVAEWAVKLGPVGWDVYGSRVPYSAFFGEAGRMVANRNAPGLGSGMFRYFPTEEYFDACVRTCDECLRIAQEQVGAPLLIAETRAVRGYVLMLRELYGIASARAAEESPDDAGRQALQDAVTRLAQAVLDTNAALAEWETAASGGNHYGGGRFADTLDVNAQTVDQVAQALESLGIVDPSAALRERAVGTWESDDFAAQERISKRFDITALVAEPGDYEFRFEWTGGWYGASVFRAALASAPDDRPDDLTEIVVDEHEGTAAYESKANAYALRLADRPPGARYYLVVDLRGVSSVGKPAGRQGCEGRVAGRKLGDPAARLVSPKVGPQRTG